MTTSATNTAAGKAGNGGAIRTAIWAAIGIFIAAHCVQVWTPLRLNTDSIHLLRMADSYQAGHGWRPTGPVRPHPIGYPVLIIGLDKLGIGTSATFVAVNIVFLLAGLWANFRLLRCVLPGLPGGDRARLAIVLLTLASWVTIKHTPIALSDPAYFGLSAMTALALNASWNARTGRLHEAERTGGRRALWLIAGFALFVASIAVRTVGMAFLPALMLAAVGPEQRFRRIATETWSRRRNAVIFGAGACAVVGGVAAALVMTKTQYGREATEIYTHDGPLRVALDIIRYRLSDLGHPIFNVNEGSVPPGLRIVVYAAGALGYAALFAGFWRSRRSFGPAWVYLAAYCAIFLVWPYSDPRFWLPVFPLAAGLIVQGLGVLWELRIVRALGVVYVVCFTALGAAAMAYSTRITFAGDRFGSVFGDGKSLKDSYQKAIGLPYDESNVLPEAVEVYERYEPRAQRSGPR
jgi:hypothetical protein